MRVEKAPHHLRFPFDKSKSTFQDAGGYVTDEELELCQTIQPACVTKTMNKPTSLPNCDEKKATKETLDSATSPSKEVLIGGDNNPSRR